MGREAAVWHAIPGDHDAHQATTEGHLLVLQLVSFLKRQGNVSLPATAKAAGVPAKTAASKQIKTILSLLGHLASGHWIYLLMDWARYSWACHTYALFAYKLLNCSLYDSETVSSVYPALSLCYSVVFYKRLYNELLPFKLS